MLFTCLNWRRLSLLVDDWHVKAVNVRLAFDCIFLFLLHLHVVSGRELVLLESSKQHRPDLLISVAQIRSARQI